MDISQIKSEISRHPDEYSRESAKALALAIEFFEDAAKLYNSQEGHRAIAALSAIENCFADQ